MYSVIRSGDQQRSPGGTVTFEGEPHGSGISLFPVHNAPGRAPTCSEDLEAGSGDIVVVGPETAHKFKNIGRDRLDIVCIHASPRIIQEFLDENRG